MRGENIVVGVTSMAGGLDSVVVSAAAIGASLGSPLLQFTASTSHPLLLRVDVGPGVEVDVSLSRLGAQVSVRDQLAHLVWSTPAVPAADSLFVVAQAGESSLVAGVVVTDQFYSATTTITAQYRGEHHHSLWEVAR